jgi:hypothetical protein
MKYLCFVLLLAFTTVLSAAPVDFPEPGKMSVNTAQFVRVGAENNYVMYMSPEAVDAHKSVIKMVSVVEFDTEWHYYLLTQPVKQIVAYGGLLCEQQQYIILTLWYVDHEKNIVLIERYQPGEFASDLSQTNTARNAMMLMACRPSS